MTAVAKGNMVVEGINEAFNNFMQAADPIAEAFALDQTAEGNDQLQALGIALPAEIEAYSLAW